MVEAKKNSASLLIHLRKAKGLSERDLSLKAGLARATLRSAERDMELAKPQHLAAISAVLDRQLLIAILPTTQAFSDVSTIAVSLAVLRDGFASWKIHYMNLVDQFRRDADIRLLLLPPTSLLDERLKALLASVVVSLCAEVGLSTPDWALVERFLDRPWFVSDMQSLKASALVESPLAFRRNNIFVQENFLARA